MKPAPLFTIIMPTHDHVELLAWSVMSVRNQTLKDFVLIIIGDGVSEKNKKIIHQIIKTDSRISFLDYPKSPRTGELYRHQLLRTAKSKYVAYISDDDLWLPDHLHNLLDLLKHHDFAYTFPIYIDPQQKIRTWYGDVHHHFYQNKFLAPTNHRYNFIPLSAAAHTLKSYHRLPHGWRSTPQGTHTDLYMWQQFLSFPHVKVARGKLPTILHFPSSLRKNLSPSQRLAEIKSWYKKSLHADFRENLLSELVKSIYEDKLHVQASVSSTITWMMRKYLKKVISLITGKT